MIQSLLSASGVTSVPSSKAFNLSTFKIVYLASNSEVIKSSFEVFYIEASVHPQIQGLTPPERDSDRPCPPAVYLDQSQYLYRFAYISFNCLAFSWFLTQCSSIPCTSFCLSFFYTGMFLLLQSYLWLGVIRPFLPVFLLLVDPGLLQFSLIWLCSYYTFCKQLF